MKGERPFDHGVSAAGQPPTFRRLAAAVPGVCGRTIERVFVAEYRHRHFRLIFTFSDGTSFEFFGNGEISCTGSVENAGTATVRERLARDRPLEAHEISGQGAGPVRQVSAPPPAPPRPVSGEPPERQSSAEGLEVVLIVDDAGKEWLVARLSRAPSISTRTGRVLPGRTSAMLMFTSATERRYAIDYVNAWPKARGMLLTYLQTSTARPDGLDAITLPSGRVIREGMFRPAVGDLFYLPDILHQPGVQLPSTNDEGDVEELLEPLDDEGRRWLVRDDQGIECVIELREHGGWWWREDRQLPPDLYERRRGYN